MQRRAKIYWYCQVSGWSLYVLTNFILFGTSLLEFFIYVLMVPVGIGISHVHRIVVQKLNIMRYQIPGQALFIIVTSVLNAFLFFLFLLLISAAFNLPLMEITPSTLFERVMNSAVPFWIWNFIYFGFKYFERYKRSEIDAVKYLAASRESEINSLKAQLNPHFIFNCLNSIRALIEEDPSKAKNSVTRLSNILRTTLMLDKLKEITLEEELALVRDYLALEQIRFEERVRSHFDIDPETLHVLVPPFIVQTQVENAIKHGLSRLPEGGEVNIRVEHQGESVVVSVANTGQLQKKRPETGVGFKNSRQRLELLYGQKGRIHIVETADQVIVEIQLPFRLQSKD